MFARLFEFLYISVYRETTFMEIFNNADHNVFLTVVGNTKKGFEILNQYNFFQEDVLNNYIHDFFVNEFLESKLDLKNEKVPKQYRNNFDWFGFGLKNDTILEENALESQDVSFTENNHLIDTSFNENDGKNKKSIKRNKIKSI